MGLTLDQLLDETGVNDLTGQSRLAKTAAAKPDFSKLAERCRQAANATPAEVSASDHHDLAEKTAAIAVINRTLDEIRAIDGGAPIAHEKTAGVGLDVAAFIKTALDRGHDPQRIAEFLEKHAAGPGLFGRIGMRLEEGSAGRALGRGAKMRGQAQEVGGRGVQQLQDLLRKGEGLDEGKREALISRLRVNHGDEMMSHLGVPEHKSYKDLQAAKGLKKAAPPAAAGAAAGGAPKALGVNVGGHSLGITADQLGKLKKPAAYAGAGYLGHKALSGGGGDKDDGSKKRGVVVVNS